MRPPAQFPKTEDELDDWSVYADWLQTRGDPLGDLIALDLSLPAAPSDAQLEAFRAAAQRRCREVELSRSAWCLGYLRKLVCYQNKWDEVEQLADTRALLSTEAAARLEDFEVTLGELHDQMPEYLHDAPCKQLFSALPPSCRRVRLEIADWFEREIAMLLELLPATVRELALDWFDPALLRPMDPAWVLSDRFDVVSAGRVRIDATLAARFAAALERTQSVHLRVDSIDAAGLPEGRWELGRPGEAALLQPSSRLALRLASSDALSRPARHGLLPVRAQIAAGLTEEHWLEVDRDEIRVHAELGTVVLVRRADVWTLQLRSRRAAYAVSRNGVPVEPRVIVPLEDGDHLELDGIECVFATRDTTRRAIELLEG